MELYIGAHCSACEKWKAVSCMSDEYTVEVQDELFKRLKQHSDSGS